MGYRERKPDQSISEMISRVLNECETLNNIRAEFRIFNEIEFNRSGKTVTINKLIFDINKTVYSQICKSGSIAVFLCTAGEETGIRSRHEMQNGDLLKGYVYDVIGSEIVEAAADMMQNELDSSISSGGNRTTNRFSPGYCGWDVAEQHKLFQLMPDNFCGIRLTESALMDPVKSISGFIGVGKNVMRLPYTCSFCDMKECFYRKERV
jgi:ethanolamine utilization microcompartment shell protein EutS